MTAPSISNSSQKSIKAILLFDPLQKDLLKLPALPKIIKDFLPNCTRPVDSFLFVYIDFSVYIITDKYEKKTIATATALRKVLLQLGYVEKFYSRPCKVPQLKKQLRHESISEVFSMVKTGSYLDIWRWDMKTKNWVWLAEKYRGKNVIPVSEVAGRSIFFFDEDFYSYNTRNSKWENILPAKIDGNEGEFPIKALRWRDRILLVYRDGLMTFTAFVPEEKMLADFPYIEIDTDETVPTAVVDDWLYFFDDPEPYKINLKTGVRTNIGRSIIPRIGSEAISWDNRIYLYGYRVKDPVDNPLLSEYYENDKAKISNDVIQNPIGVTYVAEKPAEHLELDGEGIIIWGTEKAYLDNGENEVIESPIPPLILADPASIIIGYVVIPPYFRL